MKTYIKNGEMRGKRSIADAIANAKSNVKNTKEKKVSEIRSKGNTFVKNKKLKVSSKNWLSRHLNDRFVLQSKNDGYLSRAAYKLIEIIDKFDILANFKNKKNVNIADLGASPGSWSQVILNKITNPRLVMIDILPILLDLTGENNIQITADFTDIEIQTQIIDFFNKQKIDLILSDIAPNITGNNELDGFKMSDIVESVLNFAQMQISKNGILVIKMFHYSFNAEFSAKIKKIFKRVKVFKPEASRKTSSEVYVIASEIKEIEK